ncbi:MAG TPA: NlpC/P60 family protein [Phyllobacterium sp.]|nr:NlpC/P60 family protein [Phyllobacterium sp.]
MFEPTRDHLDYAFAWGHHCVPCESCGVIAGGEFFPVKNLIDDRPDAFLMDPVEYARISSERRIEAIVHSHLLSPPAASEQDRVACENLGLPFLIVSLATGTHTVIEPTGYRAPLVGRQWGYGTHDCWSLVRDALRDYGGIETPDFSRNQWQWWQKGEDLIVERWKAAGFHCIQQGSQPQHLDVFGMQIQAPVVNHLGIFLAPDMILHQMQDKLSTREIYGGVYQKATVLHLRHERMIDAAGN